MQRTYPQARETGEFSVEGGQVVVADREVFLSGKTSRKGLGAAWDCWQAHPPPLESFTGVVPCGQSIWVCALSPNPMEEDRAWGGT